MSRYCSKCFTQLPLKANYCPVCGEVMKEIKEIETNHLLSDLRKRMHCGFEDKAIQFRSEQPKREKLTSLHIGMENKKGICKVNGEDVSSVTSHLELIFDNGEWSLMISENTLYTTNDQRITE